MPNLSISARLLLALHIAVPLILISGPILRLNETHKEEVR
jgi:hypothetical protein